ncbi:MAG: caspase family protein [Cyanobacteria bacterium P01_F01_bin.86]
MANEIQNRWAFLVGVNHYREGRRFRRLNHCIDDVLALQDLLRSVGYGVVCLHDRLDENDDRYPDTADTVVAEFRKLCQKVGPDDLLLVYFACHGTRQLVAGDEKPYLIFRKTRSTLPETALSIVDFKQEMANSPAQRQVMLLDACHMGMGTAERGGDTTAEQQFIRNVYELATGFALLAASTAQQTAKESAELEHGVFSKFVLSGLAGQGQALVSNTDPQKRFVSVDSLRKHVFNKLLIWSAEQGYDQTPQGHAEGDLGEFILVDYRHQDLPELATSLPSSDMAVDSAQAGRGEAKEIDMDEVAKPANIPKTLAPKQMQTLQSALIEAITEDELAMVIKFHLKSSLNRISRAKTYDKIIFDVIEWVNARAKFPELVRGAMEINPDNPELLKFIQSL